MPKLSGNKGEWSEIYVFLRLLELGKLFAADADLNKIDDVFYSIIKIIRNEDAGILEFRVNPTQETVSVFNTKENCQIANFSMSEFKNKADALYNSIISAKSPSFFDENTESFLNKLNVKTLKAKSTDKADIRIKIHDINTGYEAIQGFSIKSRLGGPSTLINAGKTTNFIYEISGEMSDEIMNEFNTCSKLFRNRFSVLKNNNCDIKFVAMENDVFENNLILIDSNLPKICSEMIKAFYSLGIATVQEALNFVCAENPLEYNLSNGHPFYSYKFKKMLTECALGMLPSKPWDGTADATGGYIIVREDGEVLCYHLFNRNEFENYLLMNTKFETASTSRHKFGNIFKSKDKYYIKLNLQIRFIK